MDATRAWWTTPFLEGGAVTPLRIAMGILVLLLGWLIARWLGHLIGRRPSRGPLDPAALYSLGRLTTYGLVAASLMVALAVVGMDLRTLTVVAGALGIGVGLGLQSITSNFVAGLILLFERPVRVGDRVSLGTTEQEATGQVNGYVRAIRLRSTTIQTPDNILLVVPNADLVGRTIINWSHGDPRMRIRLGISVAYDSDLERVRDAMLAAAAGHPGTIREPPAEVRLVGTGDSALEFQLLVWIPDPHERGRIESDLRLDIVRRFRAGGITIPFPQRELRVLGESRVSVRPPSGGAEA